MFGAETVTSARNPSIKGLLEHQVILEGDAAAGLPHLPDASGPALVIGFQVDVRVSGQNVVVLLALILEHITHAKMVAFIVMPIIAIIQSCEILKCIILYPLFFSERLALTM